MPGGPFRSDCLTPALVLVVCQTYVTARGWAMHIYGQEFYARTKISTRRSAETIVPLIVELLHRNPS